MEDKNIVSLLESLGNARKEIVDELHKIIVGQDEVIEQIMIALFSNGHCLIEGVPGLAKTLMISSLAKTLDLKFSRIQFTPDLMPSDITGTDILTEDKTNGNRFFDYIKGPIFGNIILADEINRTPPKTQSSLLQAMQEYQVTAGNKTFSLEKPFLVLATQNPIEQEGTYPLPEAQLDRFMFNIEIDYPSFEEEKKIVNMSNIKDEYKIKPVLKASQIIELQKAIKHIPVSEHVLEYAVKLVRSTRPNTSESPDFIKKWVSWGAGPRASQYMVLAAQAKSALENRFTPSIDDIKYVAKIILRHRVLISFAAEAEGYNSDSVVDKLINEL